MARRYNHIIRLLESWIFDLEDPTKAFTPAERWQVVRAIAQCQMDVSLEPLMALPLEIRRGLSILTMGEQLLAVMDRVHSYKERGRNAHISPSNAPNSASKPSDVVRAADRERTQQEAENRRNIERDALRTEMAQWGAASSLELYEMQLRAARDGNEVMRQRYPNWKELVEQKRL